ncbi:discoidin domain-containing protein [Anaerophaga thermohalophila]|uniref:discoidin domain-containing protein n=1 Tax=Anaerophaga thermohalophila TaxID=177400 RepID=UPI000237C8C9|nr:discoidin domain-containing protein [Anaerophaga thermohalophila]
MKNMDILKWIVLFIFLSIIPEGIAQKYTGLTAVSSDGQEPTQIFDGNTTGTMWQDSENIDDAWLIVDMGSVKEVDAFKIYWENANALDYNISFSEDGENYFGTIEYRELPFGNRVDVETDLNLSCRYIKMQGVTRQMGYGYAIYEFEVYPPFTPELTSLRIVPEEESVGVNEVVNFDVIGLDQMDRPIALSQATTWTVQPANGSSVTSAGSFSSSEPGFYVVTAVNSGLSVEAGVEVLPAEPVISSGKTVTCSSGDGSLVVDDNSGSRWIAETVNEEWLVIDLGGTYIISDIFILWETANAKDYLIEVSEDNNQWAPVAEKTGMAAGERTDRLTGIDMEGRYVRLTTLAANTQWPYSIYEFKVFGTQGNGNDNEAPSAPGALSAAPATYAVFLSWGAATDNNAIDHYVVFKNGNHEAIVDGNSTSFTVSGLNPDTEYQFSVRAYDVAGNESPETSVVTRTNPVESNDTPIYGIGNIALGMPTEHSSVNVEGVNGSSNAVDGDLTSRWESGFSDDEWMSVDLGLNHFIDRVIIHWETASAKKYEIQVSMDNVNWETVYVFNPQDELPVEPRTDDLSFSPVVAKHVRMKGVERNTQWSYSIFEFEIYSPGSGVDDIPDPNPNPNPPPVPPGPASFEVLTPAKGVVVWDSRRPTLTWENVSSAETYEIWVNITKDHYDWYQMGSLLDRFTKIGEVSESNFTVSTDLPDRWTYKWYIVANTPSGKQYSDLGNFSVYLPEVTSVNDGVSIIDGCRDLNKNGQVDPYEDWHLPVSERVNDLMSRMTIEEKAYQMFYNAQKYPLSGWAFGPGTVEDMLEKQKAAAQTRLGIPFVSAGDNIHGYATTFPTQSTLAASRNLELAFQCANMQRTEQVAVGARGVLGPLAEVGTKVLYPRIQEGCGEDADFAAAMVRALICGYQAGPEINPNSVMVTTKHWPGQGAGGEALVVYDAITAKYHLKPWFAHMDAGGATVMPGYAGSSYLDPGGPGAGDSKKIIDYLRETVGFQGPVCTDWLPWGAWIDAANAGSDIMGGADPGADGFSMNNFIAGVPEERINEAVERILNVKFRLGVFENPYGDPVNGKNTWFTESNQALAVDAARQSMTLLKNNGILPLNPSAGTNILVTGARADDGDSYRIWTSYFHDEYGAQTMYEAIKERGDNNGFNVYLNDAVNPSVAIAIVGEPTYTHGTMYDNEKPYIHDAYYAISNSYEYDLSTLNDLKSRGIPMVVVVIMPRPYVLQDVLDMADAVLIAYRPGDGGGPALAQVLFGDYPPTGRLPWQLPRNMEQIGTDDLVNQQEKWDLPFDLGATAAERQVIRNKIALGEPLLPEYGNPLFQYGFGIQGYNGDDTPTGNFEDHESKIASLMLIPNPAENYVEIQFPEQVDGLANVTIFTLKGVSVYDASKIITNGRTQVQLSSLDTGIYLVRMQLDGKFYSQILMKK